MCVFEKFEKKLNVFIRFGWFLGLHDEKFAISINADTQPTKQCNRCFKGSQLDAFSP